MRKITRRDMIKLGIASGAILATGGILKGKALAGSIKLEKGGKDFSPSVRITGDQQMYSKIEQVDPLTTSEEIHIGTI